MYYYFDDKMDLFVTTVRQALGSMVGDLANLTVEGPEDYWPAIEEMALAGVVFAQTNPEQLTLYRELVALHQSHQAHPLVEGLYAEFYGITDTMLGLGQSLGVVRTDLPSGMLEAAVKGAGEALDQWYLDHLDPQDDPKVVAHHTTELMRRMAAPKENE